MADSRFSKLIIARDGKCVYPNCNSTFNLTCSHFISRRYAATRYDFDNCDTLCLLHHTGSKDAWEFKKHSDYLEFKKKQLGEEKLLRMMMKAKKGMKKVEAIKEFMNREKLLKPYL